MTNSGLPTALSKKVSADIGVKQEGTTYEFIVESLKYFVIISVVE